MKSVTAASDKQSQRGTGIFAYSRPLLLACLLSSAAALWALRSNEEIRARVLMNPTAIQGSDGKVHLAYELHVTNSSATKESSDLTEVNVFTLGSMAAVASYRGQDLCAIAKPKCSEGAAQVTIPAGGGTVLLIWLSLPPDIPFHAIWHTMSFKDAQGRQHNLRGGRVAVAPQAAVEIGPPLGGGRYWLASEGPGNVQSHHWGSLQSMKGTVTIAQRFAIDFVGLDGGGHALPVAPDVPQASQNAEWFGYNADVLAVADGVVRDSRDGQPDGQPLAAHPEPTELTPRGLYGNFVILEIAPGIFAHYAHLRPGSVCVRAGEYVHRGDVIAHLGDSGNSGVPHLHFHISNKPTFEGSEGLPYRFVRFTLEGKVGKEIVLSPTSKWSPHPVQEQDALPLDNDVILFP
jgi:Peptidase family M23